jgi:hypothetical protein
MPQEFIDPIKPLTAARYGHKECRRTDDDRSLSLFQV